ncbi:M28 family peptidase [Nocardioides ganghwensis]|uniref:Zn-dependent exopeptidase M28 n=1 Tax=Nocardioides ganghwensis TaxID=252230 RepID=A0A4Q2S7U9_9ACTN|nr:M28 family peptidase [Nocardioides ganghwensis]MBD3944206.1 M20/M25/M40 family metallo-hydrolase [Nocardioides ganghwensis]RYB99123.1 Zn-dependent exopeptidase M28 [Nocardioides ganghwensis]
MNQLSGHDHLPTHRSDQPTRLATGDGAGALSRRGLLAGAAGGVAVIAAGQPAWAVDATRPGALRGPALASRDRQVVRGIRPARALSDLRTLSEGIGPRIGGTASEKAAAEFALTTLRSAGCSDVRLQPFPVADKFLADIGDPDGQLPDDLCWQAGASPDAGLDVAVTGRVVDVRAATAPTWPADEAAVTGAVLLADDAQDADPATRVNLRAAFVLEAQRRGAAAVVLLPADLAHPRRASAASLRLVPTTGSTPPAPTPVATIPVLGIAQVQKRLLREDLAVRPLRLAVSTTAHRGLTSNNVLADIPGRLGPAGPVVYISGHYDSVIGAPGANDDGSGTVLTLELARVLRKLPTGDATIRLALWGSEEQGLIGSRHHVAQLPQAERDRIRGVFQNDMVGTSWSPATRYWLLSFSGTGNPTTDQVAAAATRLGYDPQISPVTQRGASDHQSFQEVGIASANFSWRGEATPALLEPPYHSPEDTIEKNISMDRLTVSMELIGCAAYALAH